ncbi:ComF family protein [Paramagnetospirillum magneticum]|uniref:ComF family protein n=1 Tax=Paramagnetospirillum magneticum TaxID=84159 RepID=UPI00030C0B8A|nr:ComF family protein [Paramagnetospirillum magneticum]
MPARVARLVIDALLPPLCLSCQTEVAEPGSLCPTCWSGMVFLGDPSCACCGLPFEFDPGDGVLCGECARRTPHYSRARAVFRYDDSSKALILRFKHGDRLEGVGAFARWMARAGGAMLAEADPLLVPVPLHRWRLLSRRYNQAALLAVAIGKLSGRAVEPGMLLRTRRTPSQGHLGHDARARNVAGAFKVDERLRPRLAGRRVVLVDDVMTSGATVDECARVLLKAGAAAVDVLTLGRVVREN